MTGAGVLRGAGHGRVAQLGTESIHGHLPVGEPASHWTHQQERVHQLFAHAKQQPVGSHHVVEGVLHVGG